jgi:hypothetical protein
LADEIGFTSNSVYNAGFYWIEGGARLIAEEVVADVLALRVDHFSNALYVAAIRRRCGKLSSWSSLNR